MKQLTTRELATVLAALRYWQRKGYRTFGPESQIAEEHGEGLDPAEIDALCERLNCG